MTSPLFLNEADRITAGRQRAIYAHPSDPSKLIKVLLPQATSQGRSSFTTLTENWFPSLRTRTIRKEYSEYLRLMLANQAPDFAPPISHMYGFVSTNLGLGCLTEKITQADGTLAPTLAQLLQDNTFKDKHLSLLNITVQRLYDLNIRASDLSAHNFVVGHRGAEDPLECVVIDGFGDIHAIPVRSMARWSNALGLDDSFKRLARGKDLQWNPRQRHFTLMTKEDS